MPLTIERGAVALLVGAIAATVGACASAPAPPTHAPPTLTPASPMPTSADPAPVAAKPNPATALATPATAPQAFEATGEGPGGSELITLDGGDYALTWSAWPIAESCRHKAAFESTDERIIQPLMDVTIDKGTTGEPVSLRSIARGDYYIDVNSECGWSFHLFEVD